MVVMRYWDTGDWSTDGSGIGHASLETKDQYLSFWPQRKDPRAILHHMTGNREVTATFNSSVEEDYFSEDYRLPTEFKVLSCPSEKIRVLNRYISNLKNYDYQIRWSLLADLSDICSSENQNCISVASNALKYAKISAKCRRFFGVKRLPKWIMELPLHSECELIFDSQHGDFGNFQDSHPVIEDKPGEKIPFPDVEFSEDLSLSLDEAIKQNKKNLVKYLLDQGHQLPDACLWDISDPEMSELLIAYGANCKHKRWDSKTEYEIRDGEKDLDIEFYLKRVDKDHSSPVVRAIINEYSSLKNREKTLSQDKEKLKRIFKNAVIAIEKDDYQAFISANAKALLHNFQGVDGKTLLHIAVENQRHGIVRFLLNIGSNPDGLDDVGQSPRDLAGNIWIRYSKGDKFELERDNSILNIINKYDSTKRSIIEIFSWAEKEKLDDLSDYLDRGGNPFVSYNNETLIEFSTREKKWDVVKILLSTIKYSTSQLQNAYIESVKKELHDFAFLLIKKDPRLANFPPIPSEYKDTMGLTMESSLFATASVLQALKKANDDDDDDDDEKIVFSGSVNTRLRDNPFYSQKLITTMNIFDKLGQSWDSICEYVVNRHCEEAILSDSMYLDSLKWAIKKKRRSVVKKLLENLPNSMKKYSVNETPNLMTYGDKFDFLIGLSLPFDSEITRIMLESVHCSKSKLLNIAAMVWDVSLSNQRNLDMISGNLISNFNQDPSLFYSFLSENISNKEFILKWINTIKNRHPQYYHDVLNRWWYNGQRLRLKKMLRDNENYDLASKLEVDKDSKFNSAMDRVICNDYNGFFKLLSNYDSWTDSDLSEMITVAAKKDKIMFLKTIYRQKDAIKRGKSATNRVLLEKVENGKIEVVKVLLKFGQADTYQGNTEGYSALALAAKNGDQVMSEILIASGALINCSTYAESLFYANCRTQCPVKVARDNGHINLADYLNLVQKNQN